MWTTYKNYFYLLIKYLYSFGLLNLLKDSLLINIIHIIILLNILYKFKT